MNFLRKYLNDIKPNFEPEGKLHAFRSLFDGFETFLFVPNNTSKTGTNIHDAIDSKRIMSFVVIALLPALLFGMYNVGYQNYKAAGALADASFFSMFIYGALQVLPKIIVSYVVGLGIEFAWAQWKGEEIQEGFLVSGIIIPLIIPVGCGFCCGNRQGNLRRHRHEYLQRGSYHTRVPLLLIPHKDEWRCSMGCQRHNLRLG